MKPSERIEQLAREIAVEHLGNVDVELSELSNYKKLDSTRVEAITRYLNEQHEDHEAHYAAVYQGLGGARPRSPFAPRLEVRPRTEAQAAERDARIMDCLYENAVTGDGASLSRSRVQLRDATQRVLRFRNAAFGETSEQMRRWIEANRNWVYQALVNLVRQWEESVGMLEADASRYQDVCDLLAKAGRPVDHANGQDAHQVVELILLERTPNPDASEYARGFEAGQRYAREAAEVEGEET